MLDIIGVAVVNIVVVIVIVVGAIVYDVFVIFIISKKNNQVMYIRHILFLILPRLIINI